MNTFEEELDEIRIRLYQETIGMKKEDIIFKVNDHAQQIAQEFGIKIEDMVSENTLQTVNI